MKKINIVSKLFVILGAVACALSSIAYYMNGNTDAGAGYSVAFLWTLNSLMFEFKKQL